MESLSLPVVILAGGLGTRLRPATQTIPKALVPVRGRPFIEHQLELLKFHGIGQIVLCVGYLGEMIEQRIGDGSAFGLSVTYSYDGDKLLGTAGAIKKALPQLADRFFVIYGDSYLTVDYRGVATAFEESRGSGLMVVYRNDNRFEPSNVLFEDGQIRAYDKLRPLPTMHHVDFGLSAFHRRAFDETPVNQPTDLSTILYAQIARGDLVGYEVFTRFYEVGSPQGLAELENTLASTDGFYGSQPGENSVPLTHDPGLGSCLQDEPGESAEK